MQTIAISIDEASLAAIDRLRSRGRGLKTSRSELIRQAVQRYVADLERLQQESRELGILQRHHKKLNAQARAALDEQAEP
jgi:metal-responsive CopG/Arc/MetJ family transcriptional regulator